MKNSNATGSRLHSPNKTVEPTFKLMFRRYQYKGSIFKVYKWVKGIGHCSGNGFYKYSHRIRLPDEKRNRFYINLTNERREVIGKQ